MAEEKEPTKLDEDQLDPERPKAPDAFQDSDVPEDSIEGRAANDDDDDEISLDDIDALISDADPDFEENMQELKAAEAGMNAAAQTAVEVEEQIPLTFAERFPRLDQRLQPVYRLIAPIKALFLKAANIKSFFNRLLDTCIEKSSALALRIWHFLKKNFPIWMAWFIEKIKSYVQNVVGRIRFFLSLPLSVKAMWALMVLMVVATSSFLYRSYSGVWLPILRDRPVGSLISFADKVYSGFDIAETTPYYQAFPQSAYTLLLKHMVVSLKRDAFDSTPMATFELYFNLDSQDTAIEVKDRESELLDVTQRVIESYSYKELNTDRGIRDLKQEIRTEVNSRLNFGQIYEVYIKNKVLKP